MLKSLFLKQSLFIIVILAFNRCSSVDINNEDAVLKDIQGTWIGYAHADSLYTHIKLNFEDNNFTAWLQNSDSADEPAWTVLPNETGTISLSSVLENKSNAAKYRKLSFYITGRCCGDNSLTARTLSEMITYNNGKGLNMAGNALMTRK